MSKIQSIKKAENNITRFDIFPNSGGSPLPPPRVTELYYYENILSETIRVQATFADTGNLAPANDGSGAKIGLDQALKLGNGEKVYLEFEDGEKPTPNKLSFTTDTNALYINQKEKISEHTQKNVYIIEMVSKEYLVNESVRVIKRYDGKISDSVNKILREVVKTEKDLDIELTENKFNFIGTNKKPFWNILWLAKKSIPQKQSASGKTAGYFFFETYDGFKFKSVDTLLSETGEGGSGNKVRYKSYIFNNSDSSTVPLGYDGKILSYESANTGDFQNNLMMGTYNATNKGFNAKESSYRENPIDSVIQEPAVTFAGTEFNFVNSLFTENPSRISYSFDSVGFLPDGKNLQEQLKRSTDLDLDKSKIVNQSSMRYNQIFTIQLNITIAGDFSLRAGDIIFCDFPEVSSKKTPTNNPRMSGIYMISALCHRISNQQTHTSLELIRDSYGRKPNKAI